MKHIQNNKTANEALVKRSMDCGSQKHRGYETPNLIVYGDVRDVTLGPTPGIGESGCEFDRRAGDPLQCP